MSKERIPIEWTPELIDKLTKFSKITAAQQMGNAGSAYVLYIAQEAMSNLMLKWLEKPPTASTRTDGFYFISMKHAVINEINKQLNTKKRRMYQDHFNIQLDEEYNDMVLEIEDETLEMDYLEKLKKYSYQVDNKLRIIVKALEESEYIEDIDFEIFRLRYIDGWTLKEVATHLGYSSGYVYLRHRRIKNVINYLSKKNGF